MPYNILWYYLIPLTPGELIFRRSRLSPELEARLYCPETWIKEIPSSSQPNKWFMVSMLNNKYKVITREEEKRLIEGCKARNRCCQSEVYERLGFKMMVVCLRYAKNREEAEEILQDGFINVFRHIDQFKSEGSFEGWVKRIMINCFLRRYRNQMHLHPVISLEDFSGDQSKDEETTANLTWKELVNLVQTLPPASRLVFNLFVFEGMKHREIATLLNISEGTSKSNLSDARALLKKSIYLNYQIAREPYG